MDVVGERTLYTIFAAYARLQPDKEWLVFERDDRQVFRWTYAEFLADVHRAVNLLVSLGIGPGDVVNLHLSNHPAYPQIILAASYLGAAVMPTNPVSTADELAYLVEHSESKAIITEARCLEVVREVAARTGVGPAGIDRLAIRSTKPSSRGSRRRHRPGKGRRTRSSSCSTPPARPPGRRG
jgi:crotonobetaine/carnitine-CoA ligase